MISVSIDGAETSLNVVIDHVEIAWGRKRALDKHDPGTLKLALISNDYKQLLGQDIRVRNHAGTVVFRGIIMNVDNTRIGDKWRADIQAQDVLAVLAQLVVAGPADPPAHDNYDGAEKQGWNMQFSNDRIKDLQAVSRVKSYIDGIDAPNPIVGNDDVWIMIAPLQYGASVREVIESAYDSIPFSSIFYNPSNNRIGYVTHQAAGDITLTLDSLIRITVSGKNKAIPANSVLLTQFKTSTEIAGTTASLSVNYKVQSYQTESWKDDSGGVWYYLVNRYTDSGLDRTIKAGVGPHLALKTSAITGSSAETKRFPGWFADQYAAGLAGLNSQSMPIEVRFRQSMYDDPELYQPVSPNHGYYFIGSIFNHLPDVGPQFQINGGTLTYDLQTGWQHAVYLGPALGAEPSKLSVGSLVTNQNPTLGDYDPIITLSDLGNVTKGLT